MAMSRSIDRLAKVCPLKKSLAATNSSSRSGFDGSGITIYGEEEKNGDY